MLDAVAHVTALADGRRRCAIAEVRKQRAAPALYELDVAPDRTVLVPAGPLGISRRCAARRQRPAIPVADDPPREPVWRRGLGSDDARPREVADDRARGLVLLARARQSGELTQPDVIAPIQTSPSQPFRHPLKRSVLHPRTLDEKHVEALVTLFGEQQTAGRAGRRARPGRPPGSTPRASPVPRRGTPFAHRPCRSPSRTRWSRRSP